MFLPDPLSDFVDCKEVSVDFGIFSDALKPNKVTQSLSIQPTRAFAKGDSYSNRRTPGVFKYLVGAWHFNTVHYVDSKSMEKHLLFLLEKIEPVKTNLLVYLQDPACNVYCRLWWDTTAAHGGFDLSSSSVGRLSALCNFFGFNYIVDEKNT